MNTALLVFLSIFGVIGFFVVWIWLTGWVMDSFREAKNNNKRIEFSSTIISLFAFVIAIISLVVSLTKK